jgi:archaellin
MMLPKIRSGASWFRWGAVAALAMILPLAIPAAASAYGGPTANANSIQYVSVTVNPPSGAQTAEYDNSVYAASAHNRRAPFKFSFNLAVTSAPLVTANNDAEADVNGCGRCGATAIAFQVVLVSKQTLADLSANDSAQATTENCTTCNSLAEAFQIVYATNKWSAVRWEVQAAASQVAFQLRMLQYSGLSTDQVQARSTWLINNFISWLQGNSEDSTGWTPAINGANQTVELTGTTQPYIGLLSTIQH